MKTSLELHVMREGLVLLFLLGLCPTAIKPDHVPAADDGVTTIMSTRPGQSEKKTLSWRRTDSALALLQNDEILWQFHFGSDQSKPFFHPLALPGLGTLTSEAPPDHPWHHGLWFSWKLINGTNYWEESRTTGQSDGRTTWQNVTIRRQDDFSARIELELAYHVPDQPPVLTETRLIQVTCPGADGQFSIDWTATFTAQEQPVVLDRTPLPSEPGGKSYGGYAGLSLRLAKTAAQFEIVDSDQNNAQQSARMRFNARAVDCAGDVQNHTGGIAILDHPMNLNAPSPWYVIRDVRTPMTFFSPAVIQDGPHRLAAGDTLTLRYRIFVHAGRFDAASLQRHYKEFAATILEAQR